MGAYDRFIASSVTDMKDPNFYRGIFGELIGTFFLIFMVCNSPYGDSYTDLDHVRVSLSTGVIVATILWILSDVSGAHINPALSIALLITRKISLIRCILYIVVQCIGGILGAYLLGALTCDWQMLYATTQLGAPGNYTCGLGQTVIGPGVSPIQGMLVELLITFVLIMTVFASIDSKRSDLNGSRPLAVGLAAAGCLFGFIRQTGASMNPARTLGPAYVLGLWENHWIFWAGPILGGVTAGMMYEFIFAGDVSRQKIKLWFTASDYYCNPTPRPPSDLKEAVAENLCVNQGIALDIVVEQKNECGYVNNGAILDNSLAEHGNKREIFFKGASSDCVAVSAAKSEL